MSTMDFADVVHQSISFSRTIPSQALILDMIDNRWLQRLRDISQTANTRLVYMFSEHSRFGHCLGVAYLCTLLLDKLSHFCLRRRHPARYRPSCARVPHRLQDLVP
jgi:HD superfamily phosphohydrolase